VNWSEQFDGKDSSTNTRGFERVAGVAVVRHDGFGHTGRKGHRKHDIWDHRIVLRQPMQTRQGYDSGSDSVAS
jgi:hypothetical protein